MRAGVDIYDRIRTYALLFECLIFITGEKFKCVRVHRRRASFSTARRFQVAAVQGFR